MGGSGGLQDSSDQTVRITVNGVTTTPSWSAPKNTGVVGG